MVQLNQASQLGGAEVDGAKVNKGCGVKLGFLENIAICTPKQWIFKNGLLALKHLPLDSFLMS